MRVVWATTGILCLTVLVGCSAGPSQSGGPTAAPSAAATQSSGAPGSSAQGNAPPAWALDFKDKQGYAFHTTWSIGPDGTWPPAPDVANAPPGKVRILYQYTGSFTYRNDTPGRNAPGKSVQKARVTAYYQTTRPVCRQIVKPTYVHTITGHPGKYCSTTIAQGEGGPSTPLPPGASGEFPLPGVSFDMVVPEASAPALLQDVGKGPDLMSVDTLIAYGETGTCDAGYNGSAIWDPQRSDHMITFVCGALTPAS